MRRLLDGLYRLSGALAAGFLAAIAVIVLAQVGANIIDALAAWVTGQPIGLVIPSYANFAGFFLAASSFFALAYTLRRGGHIRVTLVIQHLGPRARHVVEAWCAGAAALVAGYFAWYMCALVAESWRFGDMSTGILPVPLWIPQAAVAAGLVVLTIALVDEVVGIVRGDTPTYERHSGEILARGPGAAGTADET